jgi:hypothetical protein
MRLALCGPHHTGSLELSRMEEAAFGACRPVETTALDCQEVGGNKFVSRTAAMRGNAWKAPQPGLLSPPGWLSQVGQLSSPISFHAKH